MAGDRAASWQREIGVMARSEARSLALLLLVTLLLLLGRETAWTSSREVRAKSQARPKARQGSQAVSSQSSGSELKSGERRARIELCGQWRERENDHHHRRIPLH